LKTKKHTNIIFLIVLALIVLIWICDKRNNSKGNSKADQLLEEQQPENRPQSGEIDFKK
jgi:hypothetical protein